LLGTELRSLAKQTVATFEDPDSELIFGPAAAFDVASSFQGGYLCL
jgi:hypothetical protein